MRPSKPKFQYSIRPEQKSQKALRQESKAKAHPLPHEAEVRCLTCQSKETVTVTSGRHHFLQPAGCKCPSVNRQIKRIVP